GHAGTLDPLATGMLPVLLGEATRFSAVGLDADKTYEVTMDLGYQTDTLDAEGEITARFDMQVKQEDVEGAIPHFTGNMEQTPPAYSAIHVDGQRAYEIARKGGKVVLAARPVAIRELALIDFSFPAVTLRVRSSKGTYIRSLARDIGVHLGMGGCVTALRRISTGGWPEAIMLPFDAVAEQREACILPLKQWLRHLPIIRLPKAEARRFAEGQRIQMDSEIQGEVTVFFDDILLGTGIMKEGMYRMVLHPVRTLPSVQRSLLA
ncbi:MAG: tRNA pseudouridine(55) synthase TruB, partial [Mariprofundaceae bacterium]|nr:tRNA pseudouridine(55) synthase TruB [Mariprofundaceae bacterium]